MCAAIKGARVVLNGEEEGQGSGSVTGWLVGWLAGWLSAWLVVVCRCHRNNKLLW